MMTLRGVLNCLSQRKVRTLRADARVVVTPKCSCGVIGTVIAGFRRPRDALLLLISTFIGNG